MALTKAGTARWSVTAPPSQNAARPFIPASCARVAAALRREDTRLEASESLRELIDSIVLTPRDGQLLIELKGNPAAMLTAVQRRCAADEGRQKLATSSCRFSWLRGLATR